jgi:hypothetical protein
MRFTSWSDKGIWTDLFIQVQVDPDIEATNTVKLNHLL